MRHAAAVMAAMTFAAIVVPGTGAVAATPISIQLVDQTPVVDPEGQFVLHLQLQGAPSPDAEIDVMTYPAASDRSALRAALGGRLGSTVLSSMRFPLADTTRDDAGNFDLTLVVSKSRSSDVITLPRTGVYPLAVVLRDEHRQVVDRFVTAIVRGSGETPSHSLSIAMMLPVTSTTAIGPDLRYLQLADEPQHLSDYADVLAAHASPVTVIPAPDLLEVLTATEDGQATLLRFDQAVASHQLLATTYVPVDPAALVASGLRDEIGLQLVAGEAAARRALPTARPDRRSWLADTTLDQATLTELQTLGVNQLVVPDSALAAAPSDAGKLRPVEVQTDGGTVPTAVVDPDLTADLAVGRSDALVAQLITAELSLAALANPDLEQGAVITPPSNGITPARLGAVLHAIEANALLRPVTLDDYFRLTRPAVGSDGEPVVRSLLPPRVATLGSAGTRLGSGRVQADSVTAMVPNDRTRRDNLDKLFLLAARDDLTPTERDAYFDAAQHLMQDVTGSVRISDQGTVTITSTTDDVPYIVENLASTPITVLLHLSSAKLEFPTTKSKGTSDFIQTLKPGFNQLTVRVTTLARATFPLTIELRTPNGRQLLASGELKLRATALSGVGIAITIGAGSVLLLWWGRETLRRRARRRRAAREQHPANQEPTTSLAQP